MNKKTNKQNTAHMLRLKKKKKKKIKLEMNNIAELSIKNSYANYI